jgi:two-component system LytT family response regulator
MRVLIVDDEPLARRGLRSQLSRIPGVEIVGECANGSQAIEAIVDRGPDLVFLDVQMPGVSGFDVIEQVGTDAMPAVVFVTAHDRYAVRAFDVQAVDYVLKPVDPDRLRDAYERAAGRVSRGRAEDASEQLQSVLDRIQLAGTAPDSAPLLDRLVVKEAGRIFFVSVAEVEWIEAAGNYVKLHAGRRVHVIRRTLDALERRLGTRFVRIRRSSLVNAGAIQALEPYAKGSYTIVLRTGEQLVSSRYYVRRLKPLIRG